MELDRTYWRAQDSARLITEGKDSGQELTIALAERLEDMEESFDQLYEKHERKGWGRSESDYIATIYLRKGRGMVEVHVRDYSNGSDLPTGGSKAWRSKAFDDCLAHYGGAHVLTTDKGEVFTFNTEPLGRSFAAAINRQFRDISASV